MTLKPIRYLKTATEEQARGMQNPTERNEEPDTGVGSKLELMEKLA